MERRDLLIRGLASVGLAAAGVPMMPRRAAAIGPAVVAGAATLAISMVRMFGPKQPDILGLLAYQTAMLNAISAEITAIQNQLTEILDKLQDLKEHLLNVPDQTVIASCKSEIGGAVLRYANRTAIIAAVRAQKGIEAARSSNTDALRKEVIEPLYVARSKLMSTYQRFSIIPVVVLAMRVELDALALVDTSIDEMLIYLSNYRKFISYVTYGAGSDTLSGSIDKIEERRVKLSKLHGDLVVSDCWTKRVGIPRDSLLDLVEADVILDDHNLLAQFYREPPLEDSVYEMIQEHIFELDNRPWHWKAFHSRSEPWQKYVAFARPGARWPMSPSFAAGIESKKNMEWLRNAKQCSEVDLNRRKEYRAAETELNEIDLQRITLFGWKAMADHALQFLSTREASLIKHRDGAN